MNQNLIYEVQSVDWHNIVTSSSDHSDMFDLFYHKYISCIVDKHIPVRQLSKKEIKFQTELWITPAIRVSIHAKNKLPVYKKIFLD